MLKFVARYDNDNDHNDHNDNNDNDNDDDDDDDNNHDNNHDNHDHDHDDDCVVGIPLYWTWNEGSVPQGTYSIDEDHQEYSALL